MNIEESLYRLIKVPGIYSEKLRIRFEIKLCSKITNQLVYQFFYWSDRYSFCKLGAALDCNNCLLLEAAPSVAKEKTNLSNLAVSSTECLWQLRTCKSHMVGSEPSFSITGNSKNSLDN